MNSYLLVKNFTHSYTKGSTKYLQKSEYSFGMSKQRWGRRTRNKKGKKRLTLLILFVSYVRSEEDNLLICMHGWYLHTMYFKPEVKIIVKIK